MSRIDIGDAIYRAKDLMKMGPVTFPTIRGRVTELA